MVMVLPMYEIEQPGVYYNTAAVIDADGTYLGKFRKQHIPQVKGFWEKFYFRPGNGGYPIFDTAVGKVGVYICYDRHFPEGWRALGLNGAEIVFNPSATHRGLSRVPVVDRAAGGGRAPTCTTSVRSTGSASSRSATTTSTGRATSSIPRGQFVGDKGDAVQARADRPRPRHGPDQGGPRRLGVLPRPPPRRVRRAGRELTTDDATMSTTLITGGTVVSATGRRDRRRADRRRDDRRDPRTRPGGVDWASPPTARSTRPASTWCPAASTPTPTWSCRSAAPRRPTRSRPAPRPRRGAASPPSSTSPCRRPATSVQDGLAAWHEKAAGNCAIDYGFHQIIGGVDEESLKAMTLPRRQRGHHQLQAVHGLSGRLLLRRRPDPAGDAERRRVRRDDHDARRERHRHRRARRAGAGPRRDRPDVPLAAPVPSSSRPRPPTGRSSWRRSPATCRSTSCTCRPRRRSKRSPPRSTAASTCSPRPARSTSTCRSRTSWRSPGFEGAKWVCSTPLRTKHEHHHERPLEGPADERAGGRVDRPLPVLHEGPEGARARRLLGDPERHRRRSSTAWSCIYQGVVTGEITLERWVETCSHHAGAHVRSRPRRA